ncbi:MULTISPECIES: phosphatase PAP2 family protein [unclassified Rathayibacter]|uniref:phosphatase PAP2 family protein n=1 Tax=unclassified Rathayibacter TaxID=2609250 RepID=UPI000CE78FB8|nr:MULTISPECIES: phosphatase PAP2 family protein [unclassified Rathayibacter]PPG03709.1 phosphoesterase PA-phosphatase [Rathayibacter sp. AY2B1]PPG66399.1 phosphoesterase PA-phosphatase [Rathayibacter sp. AY1F4]
MPNRDPLSDGEIAYRAARRWPLISAGLAALLTVLLAALIFYREHDKPFGFDTAWMNEIIEHRSTFWLVPSLVMNSLGGGILGTIVIPLIVFVALLIRRGRWAATYFAIAAPLGGLLVQIFKNAIGRPRPLEILVNADFGSFPSGHSANAATTAVVLAVVFPLWWVRIAGAAYTVAMMLSRTYLGAHWISDTVGGLLLGAGVALIVWAPLAVRLHTERVASPPPLWRRIARRRALS